MRYISLFSGIEAATVAWEPLGWEAVAFSEIEPFCCELLSTYYPEVPNLGDVSKIDWSNYTGTVDLIVGGSPCQAFSVAGNRRGLMDERGQLMLEYVRAIHDVLPRWTLWENVPGVFSQSEGDAFEALQRELEKCGYSLAWRTLDSQFFGVAQRRRRVFLVGHSRVGCAASVLFEPESLCWDFTSSRAKRESLAKNHTRSVAILPFNTSFILNPTSSDNPQWEDPAQTLTRGGHLPSAIIRKGACYAITTGHPGANGSNVYNNLSPTLTTSNIPVTVGALCARDYKGVGNQYVSEDKLISMGTYARRITPLECERLQGFPDNYTKLNKFTKDAPRYKALGNSMAVPVMRWIGERIQQVDDITRQARRNFLWKDKP